MNEYEQKKTDQIQNTILLLKMFVRVFRRIKAEKVAEQKLPKSCFKCTWAHPWRWEEETDKQIRVCIKRNNREIPHDLFIERKRAAWCPLAQESQKGN